MNKFNLFSNINFLKQLLLVLLFSVTFSNAQTYYIDYSNGNNNSNGLTQQTAWKHCPGDPSATGIALSTTLSPGSIVIFRGGVEYLGQINLNNSGTVNNYIVFEGNSGWGNGKAIFNLQNLRQYAFKGNKLFIKIDGFEFINYSNLGSDYLISPLSGANNWTIENCIFSFLQDWDDVVLFPNKPVANLSNNISFITFRNCEFFANGRTAITLRYVSNVLIENCDFGGINRGDYTGWISVGIRMEVSANKIIIRNNKFHDFWQYGGDQIPELNHAPAYIRTGSVTTLNDIDISNNYFYNNRQFQVGTGTGHIEIAGGKNIKIRNNVSVNSLQYWGGNVLVTLSDSVWIENNTFIDRNYSTSGALITNIHIYNRSTDLLGDSIWIRNNIFFNEETSTSAAIRFRGSTTDGFNGIIDNNAYFTSDEVFYSSNASSSSLSEWQNLGFDVNSVQYSSDLTTKSYFVDFPASPVNSSSGDYSLSSFAPEFLKTGGIDLSNYFNHDFNGTTRTNWSIGAIEYSSSVPDVIAPQLISALINNSSAVTLTFSEALNQSTAQNISNYAINNGITIQSLTLSGNQVFLTTSDHQNGNYTVTVNNVTDLAGNIIDPNFDSFDYQYVSIDLTPPQLISAALIDSITLNLYFSENLDPISSQNIANYSISNISISDALLNENIVTLSTSVHTVAAYSVIVNNIEDLAGNIIDTQHNTAIYEYQNNPGSGFMMLPVVNVLASVTPEPEHHAEKTIDGNGYFQGDPDSRWVGDTMPEWLVYDLGDVQILNKTKLSFYKWNEGRTYNYSLEVSVDSVNWIQVLTNVSSTTEEWSEKAIDPIDARYIKIIFISSNQLNWASLWEAEFWGHLKVPSNNEDEITQPATFSLEQNYPNPFNPTTTIKLSLPTDSNIKLVVYNMLGEEISTLADGFYETGTYEFNFNAAGLASGVYIYRLESKDLVENKKMIYLR